MYGRDEVEWQDRTWRLLENKGQREVDDWSAAFAVLGAGIRGTAVRGTRLHMWRGAVGGGGMGSLVRIAGYMAWRYGVKGGKWD